jgi:hypothetical protein
MRRLAGLKWIMPMIRVIQMFQRNPVLRPLRRAYSEYVPEVGMTGTARTMRIMLAGQLLGCIGTGPLIPNTGLAGINRIGQTTQIGACGRGLRRSAR